MPKKYPPEFKKDVAAVARRGDLTVPDVGVDFGVSRLIRDEGVATYS